MKRILKLLKQNLVVQFSVISLVVMAVSAVSLGVVSSNAIQSHAVATLVNEVIAVTTGRLLDAITPADLEVPMSGERYRQFHAFVQQSIVSERTARVKLWAKDGTVIYSDDPASVGQKFPDNENFRKALRGENAAKIKLPQDPENERERFLGTLIEVYAPIIFPGDTEPQGVFETYQYYQPTAQLIGDLRYRILVLIVAGFVIFYAVLIWLVWRHWQTMRLHQEALLASDRLASIGQLASGVAHELNNPLTSVIGFTELLMEKDVPPDVKQNLQIIYDETQRTSLIVKNLLSFVRQQVPVRQPVSLNSLVEKVLALRAYEQKASNIQVVTRFAPDLPEIMADPSQLQQVFFNIIINAEHFMLQAHQRGTLTITTERDGNIVRAAVADDGPGITKGNLKRLFTPFFTTKEVGKGTGLGLSICHGIVTEHGGRIFARSELGKGATFIVELPMTTQ